MSDQLSDNQLIIAGLRVDSMLILYLAFTWAFNTKAVGLFVHTVCNNVKPTPRG